MNAQWLLPCYPIKSSLPFHSPFSLLPPKPPSKKKNKPKKHLTKKKTTHNNPPKKITKQNPQNKPQNHTKSKQLECEYAFILQKRKCIEKVNSSAFQIKLWDIPLYHFDSFDHAVDVLISLKCIVKFLWKVWFIWIMIFLWGAFLKTWNKSFTFSSEVYVIVLFSQICFVAWVYSSAAFSLKRFWLKVIPN